MSVPSRSKRGADHHNQLLNNHEKIIWAEQQISKRRIKRDHLDTFDKRSENLAYRSTNYDDPEWDSQWYLRDRRYIQNVDKLDLHVIPVWKLGYTGQGVVVTVLDDGNTKFAIFYWKLNCIHFEILLSTKKNIKKGLEWNNTDIKENYVIRLTFIQV